MIESSNVSHKEMYVLGKYEIKIYLHSCVTYILVFLSRIWLIVKKILLHRSYRLYCCRILFVVRNMFISALHR